MKKTQLIDALRLIKHRFASFLSVCLIIALGTGGFFATRFISESFDKIGTDYYQRNNFKDFSMLSTVGVSDDDIKLIKEVDGVEDAEGIISLSGLFTKDNNEYNITIHSLTDKISTPQMIEGLLPSNADECLLNKDLAIQSNTKVGDTVEIVSKDNFSTDPLKKRVFTVTGICSFTESIRYSSTWMVILPKTAFNMEATNDAYTGAYISIQRDENKNTMTDNYLKEIKDVEDRLWDLKDELGNRSKTRITDLVESEIQKQTADARRQIEDGEKEIEANEKLLANGIADANRKIKEGKQKLADAYDQLIYGESEISKGERDLQRAEEGYKQLQNVLNQIKSDTILKTLDEYEDKVSDYQEAIRNGDNDKINQIRNEVDSFVKEKKAILAINLLEEATGKDADEVIDNLINGEGLDDIKDLIYLTKAFVRSKADEIDNLSVDQMLAYVNKANKLIDDYNGAVIADNINKIAQARDALLEFLDEGNTNLAFRLIESMTGYDVDSLIEKIKSSDLIDTTIDEFLENIRLIDVMFTHIFSDEGLDTITEKLDDLIDTYKDAIINGTQSAISKAREAIQKFFEQPGSEIVFKLIEKYTGKSFDEIEEYIITDNTIDLIENNLITICEFLKEDDVVDNFTKEGILEGLEELLDLANDYLKAVAEERQDEIDSIKQQLDTILSDDITKAIFNIIKVEAGVDLQSYINAAKVIEQIAPFIDTTQIAINAISNSEILDDLTKDNITGFIDKIEEFITKCASLAKNLSPESVEQLKDELDSIISENTVQILMIMIKYKYNIDLEDIVDTLESGVFIEVGSWLLKNEIELLKDNEKFIEFRNNIPTYIETIKNYAENLKSLVDMMQLFGIDIIKAQLDNYLGSDNVKFFIDLAEIYYGRDFKYDMSFKLLTDIPGYVKKAKQLLETYQSLPSQISNGTRQLKAAKSRIAQGWQEYYDGLNLLRSQEKLLQNGEQDALRQIAEAKVKLEEGKKELADKVSEARKEIDNRHYNWIVQRRTANISYLDYKASISATSGASKAFGLLFFMVISLVCFSTIAITVEEEKKLVGTTKAFGFYNKEIFAKYLIFGLGAAVIGCIAGIALGTGIARYVLSVMNNKSMYLVNLLDLRVSIPEIVITCLAIFAICIAATFIACTDLLKSPAALLMKGDTISSRNRKQRNNKNSNSPKGSLYSRIIIRNMINEKERVLITILIIAVSSFVIGAGGSLREGFYGMYNRQASEIYNYDFRIDYGDSDEDTIRQLEIILYQNNTTYIKANYAGRLYQNGHAIDGIYMLFADKDRITDFINLKDNKTSKPITVPDTGLLIQSRFKESYNIGKGDSLTVLDNNLETHNAEIVGEFKNYQGRLAIGSYETYRQIFNEEAIDNCFYVISNNADEDTLIRQLSNVSDTVSIEKDDNYKIRLIPALTQYDIVLVILIAIAVLMSFMVLTNLSNIYMARKKKELIVMRINGFSIPQTINYMAKETILTTIIGLVISVIASFIFMVPIIKLLEQKDTMFVRTFNIKVWIIATLLEALFSLIINSLVLQKIKKLNFREVL